jgi:type II restriction enzyme
MSHKEQLSAQRVNTIINGESKREDKQCARVIEKVRADLEKEFGIHLFWEKKILLSDVIDHLKKIYPTVDFGTASDTSFMTPDGGITFIVGKDGERYPLLIAEVKNQGTNDLRAAEGKAKQAQGNAVERLGKNVIGFRTYMLNEAIFPFVCFGDGCDFNPGSSILDRVLTIAMFGNLNQEHTMNVGPHNEFNRGSYYFRGPYWTADEMYARLMPVARKAVFYYFSKYGDSYFKY